MTELLVPAPPGPASAARHRLLLVEDDASVRRFVVLALEDQAVDVVPVATLAAAAQALLGAPFALVVCDLMLPDGSGLDLLAALARPGSASPRALRVAFSAGVNAAVRVQLQQCGVHQVLAKPVSVAELHACVRCAAAAAEGDVRHGPARPPGAPAQPVVDAHVAQAVQRYFEGDGLLYARFRDACLHQFLRDADAGDEALRSGDLAALRCLVHSLRSVMLTLGLAEDSLRAGQLERASDRPHLAQCTDLWPPFGRRLRQLAAAAARP